MKSSNASLKSSSSSELSTSALRLFIYPESPIAKFVIFSTNIGVITTRRATTKAKTKIRDTTAEIIHAAFSFFLKAFFSLLYMKTASGFTVYAITAPMITVEVIARNELKNPFMLPI